MVHLANIEALHLNNINDTDSVLQEFASIARNLKCLELNKCREFKGDGLQEIIEQCDKLETLQLGKHIYPAQSELYEINWSLLKDKLTELSITTKFGLANSHRNDMAYSSDSRSTSSTLSADIELYSSTIFNYLNNHSDCLEYLALADFTLRFPEHHEPEAKTNFVKSVGKLKYLYLRNIRNTRSLSHDQLYRIRDFLSFQFNLHTLDLIGLYLDSDFLCSVIKNLSQLKYIVFFCLNDLK